MKVTELMTGNLVFYMDGEKPVPVVVKKIDGNCNVVCLRQSDGHMFNAMIDALLPIPLSTEILEKNGFEKDKKLYQFCDDRILLTYWVEDNYLEVQNLKKENGVDIYCPFVHRLQNAICLCEIDKEIIL